jgi:bifunctional non-homologous end joining protein LigD
MKPMLCVPVKTEVELETLLTSDGWVMQQKLDGVRCYTILEDGIVTRYNRQGVGMPAGTCDTGATLHFDGEIVNGDYWVFDMKADVPGWPELPLGERIELLEQFPEKLDYPIKVVTTWTGEDDKRRELAALKESKCEGVVFKRKSSRYQPGKRSSDWMKYKFVETADVIVRSVSETGPLSIGMWMADAATGDLIDVGSVKTQPEVLPHLKVGTVIEVKYLYATDSNKLYQPVWGCLRTDKAAKECTTDQLKYTNKDVL